MMVGIAFVYLEAVVCVKIIMFFVNFLWISFIIYSLVVLLLRSISKFGFFFSINRRQRMVCPVGRMNYGVLRYEASYYVILVDYNWNFMVHTFRFVVIGPKNGSIPWLHSSGSV